MGLFSFGAGASWEYYRHSRAWWKDMNKLKEESKKCNAEVKELERRINSKI